MAIHALAHMTEYKGSNKLKQWFPKWTVPPLWGRWEPLGGRWSRNGRLGAIGDPVNNYISVVLLTLSDQMS